MDGHPGDLAREAGVILRMARLKPDPGPPWPGGERLGTDRIHGNIYRAVEAVEGAANKEQDDQQGCQPDGKVTRRE